MSLLVQYHAHPTALIDVTKEAFYPRPKVDSMVLDLDFESPYPKGTTVHEPSFRKLVKGAFAHRRKTLINSLSGVSPSFNRDVLLAAMKKCEIEHIGISVEKHIEMANWYHEVLGFDIKFSAMAAIGLCWNWERFRVSYL